uniref:Uncharacterized protein n=1 Tax=Aegilops tauschii subsp. strangulata TaxID=200361 RepID=A0A453SJ78_AEGTS
MQFLLPKLQSISPTDLATTAAAAAAVTAVDPQALLKQKGAQPNLVALRTHNNDNWGESMQEKKTLDRPEDSSDNHLRRKQAMDGPPFP